MTELRGLSEGEVIARRARGLGNAVRLQTSRSYLQILRQNAFTFINTVLFSIGLVLILMGRTGDAVVTAGLVLMNVVVGVVQEGRAKRTLDRIALLMRPRAIVIREGQERTVEPAELVVGDVLVIRPGDQIVVDGQVLGEGCVDVDESLLTGESDLIPKRAGEPMYSGSFCVTGSALYEATKVGAESLAHQMTASARAFRQVKTPLQRDIDFVIRVMVLLAAQLGTLLVLAEVMKHGSVVETVQIAAVIVALVPQGLFFMTTVTYATGAVRMAGKGALIQQANAIESMSHVDVLCMDKTGTLTTNRIQLHAVHSLGLEEVELKRRLGDMAASASGGNRTTEAIRAACGGQARRVVDEVTFSSERKWSAVSFDDEALRGVYVLGAPEMLRGPTHGDASATERQADEWTAQGVRVLLFAYRPEIVPLHDEQGEPQLPPDLVPLGLLSFSDELRPEAQAALKGFAEAGIRLKIISGDNPQTVVALARQAGFARDIQAVSGLDLAEMDESQLAQVAEEATVFGRITPQQKEKLVRALRSRRHYVAMMGDGVNDVLSLKQAQLGIAMQSGSQAARAVADMVLMEDSFAALPAAFREGQRIIRGMQDVLRLFLARTLYMTLLILGAAVAGVAFPVTPKHNSVLALLTVGIPTLALAVWAQPGELPRSVLRSVWHFVASAAFTVAVVGLAVYLGFLLTIVSEDAAQSALTTVTVLCGLVLISFVEPPTPAWVGGDVLSGDRRPAFLALGMLAAFVVILLVPALRGFFELRLLPPLDYVLIGAMVIVWGFALRFAWRKRLFERLLNLS
ncbi:MAG: ATPase, P-type (transporting), superfamily, subfamily [Chloroflexi bacterium]|nr:ATPase, P-type (transporting), superfamily, subfamily [Chloroflexota bacterium]